MGQSKAMLESMFEKLIREAATDATVMRDLVNHLIACDNAQQHLRAKGYGVTGTSILETAKEVPDARSTVDGFWIDTKTAK